MSFAWLRGVKDVAAQARNIVVADDGTVYTYIGSDKGRIFRPVDPAEYIGFVRKGATDRAADRLTRTSATNVPYFQLLTDYEGRSGRLDPAPLVDVIRAHGKACKQDEAAIEALVLKVVVKYGPLPSIVGN